MTEIYDYIVVGCGAAGSVLAGRLAENPNNKILIPEAGHDNTKSSLYNLIETPANFSNLYQGQYQGKNIPTHLDFKTADQNGTVYRYPRGNGGGGSTTLTGHPYSYLDL